MEKNYQERAMQFEADQQREEQHANRLSLVRGLLFAGAASMLIWYLSGGHAALLALSGIAGLIFVLSVSRHRQVQDQASYYKTLADINKSELKRQSLDLEGLDTGELYLQKNHPYQHDLDVFGDGSLYQLINRCELEDSKDQLAEWLSSPGETEAIAERQDAVKELSQQVDWWQEFAARCRMALNNKQKNDPNLTAGDIQAWVDRKESLVRPAVWRAVTIGSNALVFISLILTFAGWLPYQILYGPLLLNGILLTIVIRHLNRVSKGIDRSHHMIATYLAALYCIEKKSFRTPALQHLRKQLYHGKVSSTKAIGSLAALTHRLSSRANMLYGLGDLLFLLDAYLLLDLYHWKKSFHEDVEVWMATVHEFECLNSMAAFSHMHGDYPFPTITNEPYAFQATALGHPLIPASSRVTNDYQLSEKGSLDILTGSNMSGKSTFQRTIGVNMVLAQMGAPVCASSLVMGRTAIFTGMRTRDNLVENTSSFYAELKRIRQLLGMLNDELPTLYLLDEILKGTNSEDRQRGAMALSKKLVALPAFGIISTHDLMLGQLAGQHENVRNFSFNSLIHGNEIQFDYRLSSGVCKSFNASKLMEQMGIM